MHLIPVGSLSNQPAPASLRVSRWIAEFNARAPTEQANSHWLQLYVEKRAEFEKLYKRIDEGNWWESDITPGERQYMQKYLTQWIELVWMFECDKTDRLSEGMIMAHLLKKIISKTYGNENFLFRRLKHVITFLYRAEACVRNDRRQPRSVRETKQLLNEISLSCLDSTSRFGRGHSGPPLDWAVRR